MLYSRTIVLSLLAATAYSFVAPSVGTKRPSAFLQKPTTPLFLSDVSTTVEEAGAVSGTTVAVGTLATSAAPEYPMHICAWIIRTDTDLFLLFFFFFFLKSQEPAADVEPVVAAEEPAVVEEAAPAVVAEAGGEPVEEKRSVQRDRHTIFVGNLPFGECTIPYLRP